MSEEPLQTPDTDPANNPRVTALGAGAIAEITRNHERRPLDYGELAAGDIDVLLLGESHYHTALFEDIGRNAPALYEAGVRAFLVEASSDQDFSDLNSGDFRRLDSGELDVGPTLPLLQPLDGLKKLNNTDPIAAARINMIKALVTARIPIVPIDSARYRVEREARLKAHIQGTALPQATVTHADREADVADNFDTAVTEYGKVAGLMGKGHAWKGIRTDADGNTHAPTGQSAIDHGHRVRIVHFYGAGFYDGDARRPLSYLTADGWGDHAYMYQPRADDPLAGKAQGSPDWVAYVPPAPFELEHAPAIYNSELKVYPLLQSVMSS